MPSKAVLLRLVGYPLQSWGVGSVFHNRETLDFPTRSAVTGICLAGMGKSGEQRELLEQFSRLKLAAISYVRTKADGTPIIPHILEDFQIVGGGYSYDDPMDEPCIPRTEDGNKPGCGGTLMRYKKYLVGACFYAAFEGDEGLIDMIAEGLRNPVFQMFLGRKICIPGESIFAGVYGSIEEALESSVEYAELDKRKELFRVVEEEVQDLDPMYILDVPVRFGVEKEYNFRAVWKVYSSLASA